MGVLEMFLVSFVDVHAKDVVKMSKKSPDKKICQKSLRLELNFSDTSMKYITKVNEREIEKKK